MIKEYLYTIGKNLGLINDTNKPTIHVKPENPEREKLKKEEKLKKLNKELTILKWLISYQYPSASHNKYDGELRYEMIYSCKKLNVIKNTDNFHLTDSEYEKIIYDYAINTLPDMIETNCVANIDHKILLYVYTSLTARKGSDSTSANAFLSNIINCSEKDLTRKFRPAENVIPGSKLKGSFYKKGYIKYCHKTYFLIKFNKNLPDWVQDTCPKQPSDYLYKMDFAERIIFALYLWISDISIINQYSEYMNLLQNDTKFYENTVDHISEENIEIIWKNRIDFSFRYDYFYRKKKNNSKTPEKLEFIIKNYINTTLQLL